MSKDHRAPTFEEVDAHVQGLDLAKFHPGGDHHFTAKAAAANPAGTLTNICAAWKAVRPIISWLAWIPLPQSWKSTIAAFTSLLDGLCP